MFGASLGPYNRETPADARLSQKISYKPQPMALVSHYGGKLIKIIIIIIIIMAVVADFLFVLPFHHITLRFKISDVFCDFHLVRS